jgi:hypothetical protein
MCQLLDRIDSLPVAHQIHELQEVLLGGHYEPGLVGMYSKMHIYSMYMRGYTDPETVRLGYMLVLLFMLIFGGCSPSV